jgi:hypothetical protein
MTHSSLFPSLAEQNLPCQLLSIVTFVINLMLNVQKPIRFKFQRLRIYLPITMDIRHWNPKRTPLGEKVLLSPGSEDCVFENETEGPNRRLETEDFREEGKEDGVFFHGLDVEGFGGDFFGCGVFEIEFEAVTDKFCVFGFGGGDDDEPKAGGKGVCLALVMHDIGGGPRRGQR